MPATMPFPPVRTEAGNYFVSNYPPFSVWSKEQIPQLLHEVTKPPPGGAIGMYVHLPFCRQRCHYCYFRVYPRRRPEDVERYVDSVLAEFRLYRRFPALEGVNFASAYFGGGSPSYLSVEQTRRLLGGLREHDGWEALEECTFECEPGTVTPEKLLTLKAMGVTRVSIGFQSLNNDILRRSGRDTTVEDCLAAFRMARAAGFDEINVDLLAGLAGETERSWRNTVDQVLELAPECVSIYQLELTHNSALHASRQAGRTVALPSWPVKRAWVGAAFDTLEQAGYAVGSGYMAVRNPQRWRFVYTVENFWHGGDLLALGETAFGHFHGVHYQNLDTYEAYVRAVGAGKFPVHRACQLSEEEELRREVILLLKTGRLEAGYFREKFGIELVEHFEPEWEELLGAGLATMDGDGICLTREGLLQVDWLLPRFYLPEHRGIRYS